MRTHTSRTRNTATLRAHRPLGQKEDVVLLVNGWAPHPAMKVHGSMYQAGMHCSSQKKGQKLVEVVGQPLGARMGQPLGARVGAGERAQHPSDPPLSMPGRHLSNPKIEAMIT
mmetsp:Transcript_7140/g.10265  ORF Transcript_7140/g.10265 Transcript_7140/m.10265 type:complete len:113 (-) Transcript_7140:465-803(-)